MKLPISTINDTKWFRNCIGCVGWTDTDYKCDKCCRCPYAICGSHNDLYQLSEAFKKGEGMEFPDT